MISLKIIAPRYLFALHNDTDRFEKKLVFWNVHE